MNLRTLLLRLTVALWILLFGVSWWLTARADDDMLWLAPTFFLPQFALVAGLAWRSGRHPWPWAPFLTTAVLSAAVIGLSTLFLVGSVLEALNTMGETLPAGMIVIPLVAFAASFCLFLPLRGVSRRRAAVYMLASICFCAGLSLMVAAGALPTAERRDVFLPAHHRDGPDHDRLDRPRMDRRDVAARRIRRRFGPFRVTESVTS